MPYTIQPFMVEQQDIPLAIEDANLRQEEPVGRRSKPGGFASSPGLLRFARNDESSHLQVRQVYTQPSTIRPNAFALQAASLKVLSPGQARSLRAALGRLCTPVQAL